METVVGTRTKLELISYSHGAIRVPLAQSFDVTPRLTERTIFEFDNDEAALIVTSFDGADIRFDYFDSDSKLVDAMFNDLDPGATVTLHDPSVLKRTHMMLNARSETTGLIFQSVLAKFARVRGIAAAEPVREESRITVDATATNAVRLKGAAIQYARFTRSAPGPGVYVQDASNSQSDLYFTALDANGVGTFAHTNVAINEAGDYALQVLHNGEIADPGYYIVAATTFTANPTTVDDVWEVWTAYIDS